MGLLLDQLKISDNKIYSDLQVDLDHRSQRKRVVNDYSITRLIQKTRTIGKVRKAVNRVSLVHLAGKYIVSIKYRLKPIKSTPKISLTLKSRPKEVEVELPYKGVLPFPDCTINDTEPTKADRDKFEELKKAGEILRLESTKVEHEEETNNKLETGHFNSLNHLKSQVKKIVFRECEIDTWYTAPYPAEYSRLKVLFICEHCLTYMNLPVSYGRHQLKNCNLSNSHPPGVEIYRDSKARVSVWEVDGRKNVNYCQNLCLLAKLFLNLKTLYYDVEPFIFYVLAEIDESDSAVNHFVGYFSKEKLNSSDYNVSCILTLPIYQRKGYGNFLIDFSYLLSRSEFKFGTPEKPLSDLGLLSYRNYWKVAIAIQLRRLHDEYCNAESSENSPSGIAVSIEALSKLTGMIPSDVVVSLEQLNSLIKNPVTGTYSISINLPRITKVIDKWRSKLYVTVKPTHLLWKPMLFGPSGGINSAPPMLVPNSISLITNFLKDDINNPISFEEEALKEVEQLTKELPRDAGPDDNIDNYLLCHPGIQFTKKKIPIKQSTEKLDIEILKENSREPDMLELGSGMIETLGPSESENYSSEFEEVSEVEAGELEVEPDDVDVDVDEEEIDEIASESDSSIEVATRRSARVHLRIEPEVRRSLRRLL